MGSLPLSVGLIGLAAVAEVGSSRAPMEKLRSLEAERDHLSDERQGLERLPHAKVEVPPMGQIRALAASEAVVKLASIHH